MAQLCISYAHQDRGTAERLADVLDAEGWSVWWDRLISPGRNYHQVIEQNLESAGCVIVLWSSHSVRSRWVLAEADLAAQRETLLPALLEHVEQPLAFKPIQAVNLVGWPGDHPHPGLVVLLEGVRELVEKAGAESGSPTGAAAVGRKRPLTSKREAYAELWRRLEAIHTRLRIEDVGRSEFETDLRDLNVYVLQSTPFLEEEDWALANRYLDAVFRLKQVVEKSGNQSARRSFSITSPIPDEVLATVTEIREADTRAQELRRQIAARIKNVLETPT